MTKIPDDVMKSARSVWRSSNRDGNPVVFGNEGHVLAIASAIMNERMRCIRISEKISSDSETEAGEVWIAGLIIKEIASGKSASE